jgi:hypothetical protein
MTSCLRTFPEQLTSLELSKEFLINFWSVIQEPILHFDGCRPTLELLELR